MTLIYYFSKHLVILGSRYQFQMFIDFGSIQNHQIMAKIEIYLDIHPKILLV